jgi:hypothetical protein
MSDVGGEGKWEAGKGEIKRESVSREIRPVVICHY